MKIRLWLFTARPLGNRQLNPGNLSYPEGGTYDTSVLNDATGDCSDPAQFDRFQSLLAYANARGEKLQQVTSAQEAYSMCSRARVAAQPTQTLAPPPQGPSYSGSFSGGALQHALYTPTQTSICGCNCPGGGQYTQPPVPQYASQGATVDNVNRLINLARNRPFGTVVF